MNFLKVSFALSLIICFFTSNAQAPPPITNSNVSQLPAIKSPQANELGRFGNVPVSKYTGAPSITIPLAEVTNGPIKVPVYLQYNATGCRPEEHPTWVGLNWSLSAGGIITRNTNGKTDEFQDIYADPNTSYLEKYWANGVSDWNQHSYMEYVTESEDRAPDEFVFSFNGISGSFYLNYDGKWVVKSKEGVTLKVAYVESFLNYYDASNNYFGVSGITQFTLKTDDGTTYIFGREVNAIEFSLPALYDGVLDGTALLHHSGPSEACAWHISEIIAPTGQHINFTYATAYSFKQVTYSEVLFPNPDGLHRYINMETKFLTTTPYLSKIEADNGMSCGFAKSPSNELKYVFSPEHNKLTDHYADFNRYGIPRANLGQYYKLDNIVLSSKNGLIKAINLKYIENPNERLKLKTVQATNWTSDAPNEQYSFDYNPSLLPPYNTAKEDHWGFYNGKNYFTTENGQFYVENYLPDYIASRSPDATLMQSEILTKITYPTKGYTKFYFEPHDYSSVVYRAPTYQLGTGTNNVMAGGLRIKKLEDYDGISSIPVVKEYFYTKNYIAGGTLSSGILASNPTYWEKALNSGYALFSSKSLGYKNLTNGNHITYSEVTEKSNNGYIVSTYTNQDNGYLDKPPFNILFNESPDFPYEKMFFNSLELERGLELSLKYYASDKFLLKEIYNEYNNDPARYNKYVRSVQIQNYLSTYHQGKSAYGIYAFYPYLKSQTEKQYFRAGGDISSKKDYTYDPNYNHLRSFTNTTSEGTKTITKYTYPYNYSNGDPGSTATINVMVSRNILNTPIEISTFVEKSGIQSLIESKLNIYNTTIDDLTVLNQQYSIKPKEPLTDFSPASASLGSSIVKDPRYVLKTTLESYDNKGNLLQYTDNSGTTSYIWGYDQSFPIAEVKNATVAQIAYNGLEMGGSPGQLGWENFGPATTIADFDVKDKSASFAGLYAVKIAPPSSGGINYATTINVTPGPYSKEKYKMSCWIKTPVGYTSNKAFITMYTIKANTCCAVYPVNSPISQTFILATNGKWQYFETYLDLGAISALLTPGHEGEILSIRAYSANTDSSFPVYVDEVRVHPVDALMKTYTYNFNPQVGLSTVLDENNQIINRYEYNIFNKLKVVRDKDNNIVKKINYKYKGNYLIKCEGLQGKSLASYDFIAPNDAIRECTPGGTVSYKVSGDFNIKIDGIIRALPYTCADGTSWTKIFDRDYFLSISATNGSHSFTIIFNN